MSEKREDRPFAHQVALLKVALILKKNPPQGTDEVIDKIVRDLNLDPVEFRKYFVEHYTELSEEVRRRGY